MITLINSNKMAWKKLSHFAMKMHLNKINGPKQILALDMGSLWTGVAISCYNLKKAYVLVKYIYSI